MYFDAVYQKGQNGDNVKGWIFLGNFELKVREIRRNSIEVHMCSMKIFEKKLIAGRSIEDILTDRPGVFLTSFRECYQMPMKSAP